MRDVKTCMPMAIVALLLGCCALPVCSRDELILQKVVQTVSSASGRGAYRFEVVDSPVENAVCKPDGTIAICSGMMKLFRSEDEIAAVVAHEIGHAVAKHSGDATPQMELEADRIGIELMAKAGYDPRAAVDFWTRYYERINWFEGSGSHPDPHERVARLRELARIRCEADGRNR